jgi:hypothetical protein
VLADYPDLEPEDIRQALGYEAWLTKEEVHPGIGYGAVIVVEEARHRIRRYPFSRKAASHAMKSGINYSETDGPQRFAV